MKGIGNAKTLIQSDIYWLLANKILPIFNHMVQQDPLTTRQSAKFKNLFPNTTQPLSQNKMVYPENTSYVV